MHVRHVPTTGHTWVLTAHPHPRTAAETEALNHSVDVLPACIQRGKNPATPDTPWNAYFETCIKEGLPGLLQG